MAKTISQLKEENLQLQKEIIRLEVSLEKNQERLEDYEKRCGEQNDQILRLQDALVAREAPDAYAARREEENVPEMTPEQEALIKRNRDLANINREILDRMGDEHYFESADNMIELLTQDTVPTFEKLHENNES